MVEEFIDSLRIESKFAILEGSSKWVEEKVLEGMESWEMKYRVVW